MTIGLSQEVIGDLGKNGVGQPGGEGSQLELTELKADLLQTKLCDWVSEGPTLKLSAV